MKHYTQSSQNLFFNKIQSMTTSHKGKYFFMKLWILTLYTCVQNTMFQISKSWHWHHRITALRAQPQDCDALVCARQACCLSQTQIALFTSALTHFSLSNFYPKSHVWNMWQCNLNMLSAGNKQGRRQALSKVLSERQHLQQPLPNSKLFCT